MHDTCIKDYVIAPSNLIRITDSQPINKGSRTTPHWTIIPSSTACSTTAVKILNTR